MSVSESRVVEPVSCNTRTALKPVMPKPVFGLVHEPIVGPIDGPNHAPIWDGLRYAARFKSRVKSRSGPASAVHNRPRGAT
jgi:hypothetical protein